MFFLMLTARPSTLAAGSKVSIQSCVASGLRLQQSVHARKRTLIVRSSSLLCFFVVLLLHLGSCLPVLFAGYLPSALHRRGHVRPKLGVVSASLRSESSVGGGQWRAEEDWALADETPSFTVGKGANTVTFWSALATTSTVLCQRTAAEVEQRMSALAANTSLPQSSYGSEPSVITSWERMPDGRFTGSVEGRAVWLTVELEGRLASDPRSGVGYVVSLGGRVYELGESRASSAGKLNISPGRQPEAPETESAESEDAAQFDLSGILRSVGGFIASSIPFVGVAVVSLVFGVFLQMSTVPPQVIKVSVTQVPSVQATQSMLPAKAASQGKEQVQLLLSEQRVRQQIQVDKVKAQIASLESKVKLLDEDSIKTKVVAEEARLQANRERQVITDKEKVSAFESRLRSDLDRSKGSVNGLELKLREDQERLAELQRVEAERGPGADAVQLSVVASGGGTSSKAGPLKDGTSVPSSASELPSALAAKGPRVAVGLGEASSATALPSVKQDTLAVK